MTADILVVRGRISTLDTADEGFALLVEDERAGRRGVVKALDIPVAVHPLGPGDAPPGGALLRPDGVIAWKPETAGDLAFEPLTDPATYEAVRASGSTVLCWKPQSTQLKCVASAPRRRPAQIELFVVHGFGEDFNSLPTNQSLNIVTTGLPFVRKP